MQNNNELYKKWIVLKKNLSCKLNIKTRFERKKLWETIKEIVKYEYNPFHIFIEYKLRYFEIEIFELFKEKMAIEKIKPYLKKYIIWRLYNPDNGIRFLKLRDSWYKQF
jgi:hypothetical protein